MPRRAGSWSSSAGATAFRRGLCRVNRAVFSPDGSRIATTGRDATVRIFDAATGRQLRVLRGHAPGGFGTYPVAWSPDGARLLSMAADGTRIWDARTGRQLLALPPVGGPGASAVWSPDGRQVLIESGLGPVVWDASSGERLRTLETSAASSDMEFSRDGSRLANTTVDERGFAHPDLGLARGRRDPEAARQWPARRAQPGRPAPRRRCARDSRCRSCASGRSTPSSCSGSRGAASPAR